MENQIRVFISYSHSDVELVRKIKDVQESQDLQILWNKKLSVASRFESQMKVFTEHAHVFRFNPSIAKSWMGAPGNWIYKSFKYPGFPGTIKKEVKG